VQCLMFQREKHVLCDGTSQLSSPTCGLLTTCRHYVSIALSPLWPHFPCYCTRSLGITVPSEYLRVRTTTATHV
jgi:hypothetical protein